MSYTILATVSKGAPMNTLGDVEKVGVELSSQDTENLFFSVPGEFGDEPARIKRLCNCLLHASFYEFKISHEV